MIDEILNKTKQGKKLTDNELGLDMLTDLKSDENVKYG